MTDVSPRLATPIDAAALRAREFAALERDGAVYLNSASTGPLPARARAVLDDLNARRATPHRVPQEAQFGPLARARELCARLVGAETAEIALEVNTSYGVNLAARALPLRPDETIVVSDREFPANVYPWMALERARGARLRLVPTVDELPDEEGLLAALDEPGVRVLAVSWVQFGTGYRADLARLGRACRERGIWFVVDAIQGLGPATLDVRACHVDVLACGGQKWLLSPWGTGFAYVRRELLDVLQPPDVGWLAVRGADDFTHLTDYDLTWRDSAWRYEVGTLPYQDFAAMVASLELLFELGPERVAAHATMLADRIVDWALANPDRARLVTPADAARRAGIVSLVPADGAAALARLAAAGVVFSDREGAVRLAPHCFNTTDDVDAALRALEG
ncbi:MAG TPA: aminotransferase class V-fold PLP-dependent enzyme [Gemmatimonadaceae bacterium]|nr:aminotransferase class V-fold PLP-dependent enzyme [Gemmatimonadaceae bacterium]